MTIEFALAAAVFALALAECAGRIVGIHRVVAYEATPYGYRVLPSQRFRRFGATVEYNSLGLRSPECTCSKPKDVFRVLCVGDSITNGGALTDQAETYPYQLQLTLQRSIPDRKVEVLNISAGGWALDNELGWLEQNGVLESDVVVFEVGTHDLWQPMAEARVVGTHPSFPPKPPRSALAALMTRQIIPRVCRVSIEDPGTEDSSGPSPRAVVARLETLAKMTGLARASGAYPIVLHIEQPQSFEPKDDVVVDAKGAMREFLARSQVPCVSAGAVFRDAGDRTLFRDAYHPNEMGNRLMAEIISPLVLDAAIARSDRLCLRQA